MNDCLRKYCTIHLKTTRTPDMRIIIGLLSDLEIGKQSLVLILSSKTGIPQKLPDMWTFCKAKVVKKLKIVDKDKRYDILSAGMYL